MDVYLYLDERNICYERYDHPAVFTCEEAERLVPKTSGKDTKNLFLRDKKGRRHFLVVVGYEKTVDMSALARELGVGKLSLASAERLQKYLGVDPGSVSILGVLNDRQQVVEVIIDEAVWQAEAVRCHPLVNTSTLVIGKSDLERILRETGHNVTVIDVPIRN